MRRDEDDEGGYESEAEGWDEAEGEAEGEAEAEEWNEGGEGD